MAHQLEMKNGKASMFYTGSEKPWHGLGTSIPRDRLLTSMEGLKAAGLDWTVSCHPMEAIITRDGNEMRLPARGRMVIRDSDNTRLSEVGPNWHPLQNHEAFKWFDPFLEKGEAFLDTAGSLFDGEKIWVLAKLNRDPMKIVGDDVIDKYLLLSNAHSDKFSCRPALTAQRVVCDNTLCAALNSKATKSLRVRHSSKIVTNLEDIRGIINAADAEFEATAEQYRALTRRGINAEDLKKYVKVVFKQKEEEDSAPAPEPKKKRAIQEDDSRLIENKIIEHFENGRGAKLPGVAGTLWGAYNAVTSFLTWERGRTADARLDQLWFGAGVAANHRALETAIQMLK